MTSPPSTDAPGTAARPATGRGTRATDSGTATGTATGTGTGTARTLEVDAVTRRFGDVRALDGMTFRVAPGRLTGFVGANGAGKTTTMRVVLGVTRPETGEVRWDGAPIDEAVRRSIGYMPEERGLYPKMPVLAQLVFLARLHGLDERTARASATDLLEQLGLADRADAKLESLSLGNQQRVQVAAALVHDPALMLLDEPFSGLDPVAVDALAALLRERAARGVPVLFSSHQLELVERLCDDVVIVAAGRTVAQGRAEDLRRDHAPRRHRLVTDADAGWLRQEQDALGLEVLDVDGGTALVELRDPAAGGADDADQALLRAALARGPVRSFTPVVPTLAEIFREVTR